MVTGFEGGAAALNVTEPRESAWDTLRAIAPPREWPVHWARKPSERIWETAWIPGAIRDIESSRPGRERVTSSLKSERVTVPLNDTIARLSRV